MSTFILSRSAFKKVGLFPLKLMPIGLILGVSVLLAMQVLLLILLEPSFEASFLNFRGDYRFLLLAGLFSTNLLCFEISPAGCSASQTFTDWEPSEF